MKLCWLTGAEGTPVLTAYGVCLRVIIAANPQHWLISKWKIHEQQLWMHYFPFSSFLMWCLKFTKTIRSSCSADVAYSSHFGLYLNMSESSSKIFCLLLQLVTLEICKALFSLVPALSLLQNHKDVFCCGDDNIILDVVKDVGCLCYWIVLTCLWILIFAHPNN